MFLVGTVCFVLTGFANGQSSPFSTELPDSTFTPEPCETGPLTEAGYPNIYCFDLVPTPVARGATGRVDLLRPESPFTVAVNRDGNHRYRIKMTLDGLPDPRSFGEDFRTYVAWLTSPELRPVSKLGEVRNGSHITGHVELNKYIIIVSAEPSADVPERTGKLVLRALSPSSRMEAHDLAILSPVAVLRSADTSRAGNAHHHDDGWRMPPPHPEISMAPGMHSLRPEGRPYLPSADASIPLAKPTEILELNDGDTVQLSTGMVRKTINGRDLILYGFNGQFPGPRIKVEQGARVTVEFRNHLEWPTAVHWHGLRLENEFDGVPGVTQDPVLPGDTFTYEIVFPDAGIYWYHPHHREDIQQDLGLYGNMLVDAGADYWGEVDVEDVLLLDDILLDDKGVVAYGADEANFALMGRFGNTILVNGEPEYNLDVAQYDRVRLYLTNTSNTRVLNLSIPGLAMKVVASDVSKYERDTWVESVVIAPAERYVIEVQFTSSGRQPVVNRVQGINHLTGVFFQESDTLGYVNVTAVEEEGRVSRLALEAHTEVSADIDAYRKYFYSEPERHLMLTLQVDGLDPVVSQLMQLDPVFFNPVEWSGTMPMMNWQSSPGQVHWILKDLDTGAENMDIDWSFETRDVVKVRLLNDRDAFHAMQHPLHLHGQRFLILEQDGVRNTNLVWKDTILLPVGSTADILLDVSNPGQWMIHCHIAEHLEAGMKMVFSVDGESTVPNRK